MLNGDANWFFPLLRLLTLDSKPKETPLEPIKPIPKEEDFEEIEIEEIKGYEEVEAIKEHEENEITPEVKVEELEQIEVPTVEEHQKTIEDISPEEIVILEEIHQKFEEKETKEEKIEVKKN